MNMAISIDLSGGVFCFYYYYYLLFFRVFYFYYLEYI